MSFSFETFNNWRTRSRASQELLNAIKKTPLDLELIHRALSSNHDFLSPVGTDSEPLLYKLVGHLLSADNGAVIATQAFTAIIDKMITQDPETLLGNPATRKTPLLYDLINMLYLPCHPYSTFTDTRNSQMFNIIIGKLKTQNPNILRETSDTHGCVLQKTLHNAISGYFSRIMPNAGITSIINILHENGANFEQTIPSSYTSNTRGILITQDLLLLAHAYWCESQDGYSSGYAARYSSKARYRTTNLAIETLSRLGIPIVLPPPPIRVNQPAPSPAHAVAAAQAEALYAAECRDPILAAINDTIMALGLPIVDNINDRRTRAYELATGKDGINFELYLGRPESGAICEIAEGKTITIDTLNKLAVLDSGHVLSRETIDSIVGAARVNSKNPFTQKPLKAAPLTIGDVDIAFINQIINSTHRLNPSCPELANLRKMKTEPIAQLLREHWPITQEALLNFAKLPSNKLEEKIRELLASSSAAKNPEGSFSVANPMWAAMGKKSEATSSYVPSPGSHP